MKPLIDDSMWVVPGGSNQQVKTLALIRNISAAVDNQIENMVSKIINDYQTGKRQDDAFQEIQKLNEPQTKPKQPAAKSGLMKEVPKAKQQSRYGAKPAADDDDDLKDIEDFLNS